MPTPVQRTRVMRPDYAITINNARPLEAPKHVRLHHFLQPYEVIKRDDRQAVQSQTKDAAANKKQAAKRAPPPPKNIGVANTHAQHIRCASVSFHPRPTATRCGARQCRAAAEYDSGSRARRLRSSQPTRSTASISPPIRQARGKLQALLQARMYRRRLCRCLPARWLEWRSVYS